MLFSSKNKRKHYRIIPDRENPIRVDLTGSNFIDIFHARDISIGGIRLQVNHRFKGCNLADEVSMVITLPHFRRQSLSVNGLIRHTNDNFFGVQFTNLSPKGLEMIHNYIRYRMRDEPTKERFKYWLNHALKIAIL